MSQFRDEAEAIARALEIGVCDIDQVIEWADAQITNQDQPHPALCEVAISRGRYPQDIASMLRRLPSHPDMQNMGRLLVVLLNARLRSDPGRAGQIARALYRLALAGEIEDPDLEQTGYWAWDALDLADAGITTESRDQVVARILESLGRAAELAASVGPAWGGARRPPV